MLKSFTWITIASLALVGCVDPADSPFGPDVVVAGSVASGPNGHFGHAFGTQAFVDREEGFVHLGPSAASSLACATGWPSAQENTVVTVDASPLVRTGAVNTRVEPLRTADGVATRAQTDIADVNILDGLIRARAIRAVSTASFGASGYGVSDGGTEFVDLVVAGLPIAASVGPNTRIELPGVGYAVLNEQERTVTGDRAELRITMIRVVIEAPGLGVPWGTQLIVSRAEASTRAIEGVLSGHAYGSEVEGPTLRMGRSALLYIPCLGTDGETMTLPGAEVRFHNVLDLGAVRSDVRGTVEPTRLRGETGSTITDVNVLDGLITAQTIAARANIERSSGVVTASASGSSFVDLTVAGQRLVSADIGNNTRISIADLGTLWLRRVIRGESEFEVRMIELVVEVPNQWDLPIGTVVRVGVANVGVQ